MSNWEPPKPWICTLLAHIKTRWVARHSVHEHSVLVLLHNAGGFDLVHDYVTIVQQASQHTKETLALLIGSNSIIHSGAVSQTEIMLKQDKAFIKLGYLSLLKPYFKKDYGCAVILQYFFYFMLAILSTCATVIKSMLAHFGGSVPLRKSTMVFIISNHSSFALP